MYFVSIFIVFSLLYCIFILIIYYVVWQSFGRKKNIKKDLLIMYFVFIFILSLRHKHNNTTHEKFNLPR